MSFRILCIGDVVGQPGREILKARLPALKEERRIDFVVANGENAAGGSGLTSKVLREILEAGVDVVTSGDHVYKNKEVFECLGDERLLRPLNYVPAAAGHGAGLFVSKAGARVAVVNLVGRVFMNPAECPFLAADTILDTLRRDADLIVVDIHAEATSEKIAMGWHLDGRVTAVVGTHTHVPTADERILPGGTAYLTDLGMTGAFDSVLGRDKESVLYHFTTAMPARFAVATGDVRLCAALIAADPQTGRALSIERLMLYREREAGDAKEDGNPAESL
ncbi:MAG: TIGR00282 family metallophosphoesterase [Planctomycetota bacterium]